MENAGFAKVIIDLPAQEIDRPFDYAIPSQIRVQVKIGSMVLVNFGHALQIGYVIELVSRPCVSSPSPILEVLDDNPVFDEKMVRLCQWVCDYYLSTLGQALKLAIPPGRGRHVLPKILLIAPIEEAIDAISPRATGQKKILFTLDRNKGEMPFSELQKMFGKGVSGPLRALEEKYLIAKKYEVSVPQVNVKKEEYVRLEVPIKEAKSLADQLFSRAPRQCAILHVLVDQPQMSAHELLSAAGASRESLRSLAKKGVISTYLNSTYREPDFYYPETVLEEIILTREQDKAIGMVKGSLSKDEFRVFLLQGITGSGKTEIYIRVIEEVIKASKSAIVLVPEIALTPQTANRFRRIFDDKVAVLHSGLGIGERFDQWRRIRKGQYKVVVGARSALFAPLKELGLIVVDEEHETTYKQGKNPRYHAVNVALKRAEIERCPVILGSATPAIESRYKAETGGHAHIILGKRVGDRELPQVQIVDMREELKQGNRSIFSSVLQEEMKNCLDAEGKFILFINRRGYSNFLLCRDCGFVPKCKRCAVSLTYHQYEARLLCHHCNYTIQAPQVCPNCGSTRIRDFGTGTQKVESELNKLIPDLSIIRMDADTTTGRDAHRKRLVEFQQKRRSVLLGTQMIAKGLDFPEVTLVGIVNGDTALNLPDFRAAERTFQLLMQVSGRAGRGAQPGKVVLQTYLPDNYAIAALLTGEYDPFYEKEISLRKELVYPPFCQLINITVSGRNSDNVEIAINKICELISSANLEDVLALLGPSPAPLARIKNRFRWHAVLKVANVGPVSKFIRGNLHHLDLRELGQEISVVVDVDPVWML